jgi:hypothetical protein
MLGEYRQRNTDEITTDAVGNQCTGRNGGKETIERSAQKPAQKAPREAPRLMANMEINIICPLDEYGTPDRKAITYASAAGTVRRHHQPLKKGS